MRPLRAGVFLWLALVPTLGFAESQTETGSIPTDHFFKDAAVSAISMSPDGKHVAIGVNGGLAVMDVDSRQIVSRFQSHSTIEEVYQIWWVSDRRFVFNTVRYFAGHKTPYLTGDFFARNVDGSRPAVLTAQRMDEYAYEGIGAIRNDPSKFLMQRRLLQPSGVEGSRPAWVAVDVFESHRQATGTLIQRRLRARTGPLPNGRLYADGNGQIRLAAGFDSGAKVLYRDDNNSEWRDVTAALGRPGGRDPWPIGFVDDEKLYFASDMDADTQGLYVFDPATGESTLLYRRDGFDIDTVIWNAARTRILGVTVQTEYPALVFFDAEDPETQLLRSLTRSFPGHAVRFASSSRDGKRRVLLASSDRNPGQAFLYDRDANAASYLFSLRPDFDRVELPPRQPFTVETDDGFVLRGYLTRPETDSPVPLLVLPHGGPHGVRDTWAFDPEAHFFANRGFAVLQVNFRGSGGYGRAFQEAGYHQWGDHIIDDILLATDWARTQPNIDEQRVCIYGASFGAYAAMMAAIRAPDTFRCAIGLAGVYDLELMYGAGDIPAFPEGRDYLERAIGTDSARLRAHSPVHQAHRLTIPVMIAHGGADVRAPMQHAERLRNALRQHGRDAEWVVDSREGHGFYDEALRIDLYERMLAFATAHTAMPATASTPAIQEP